MGERSGEHPFPLGHADTGADDEDETVRRLIFRSAAATLARTVRRPDALRRTSQEREPSRPHGAWTAPFEKG